MAFPNFSVTTNHVNGTTANATNVNGNFADVEDVVNGVVDGAVGSPAAYGMAPIGSIVAWHKTLRSISSGNADTNTVDKLVDSGATFSTDGVVAGMIIHNTTDDTFGIVSAVDSETSITIKADSNGDSAVTDVFPLGTEAYNIYATPELPDNWLEMNGQAVSDADSPFNGVNLQDLNGNSNSTKKFLRGSSIGSGTESGSSSHTHTMANSSSGAESAISTDWVSFNGGTGVTNKLKTDSVQPTTTTPVHMDIVWIIRIK
tara:strand:+ start:8158 stop:8934 length:777 start_codon:yes stop_codon:yes gene_type:complete